MSREFLKDAGLGISLGIVAFLILNGQSTLAIPLMLVLAVALVIFFHGNLPGIHMTKPVGVQVTPSLDVSFDDIGGQEAAKRELLEALQFIKDPERFRRLGIRPLRGIMLAGPPGTGKTLLAKAAANYCGSAFLAASGSEFIELYAGVGAQRIRQLFKRARQLAQNSESKSAVLFIDEIEVLAGQRGRHASHQEYDQTVNQLLVEMDGLGADLNDNVTVVVIGATNRIDLMDEALLRPGRFDRIVQVQLPDKEARRKILQIHMRGRPIADDVDVDSLAHQTFGFSGAHLEAVVNEAAIFAWRSNADKISQRHLEEAVEKVLLGEREVRPISEAEKHRVAVHEAGHALVSELLRPGSVASVTIVPRGAALGYVRQRPTANESMLTQHQLEAAAKICLAGYVAEQIVFGSTSTGVTGDLNQLNQIIDQMITSGMSPLGPAAFNYLPPDERYRASAQITEQLREQVAQLITNHRNVLDCIVERLLVDETLDGAELRTIIEESKTSTNFYAGISGMTQESPYI